MIQKKLGFLLVILIFMMTPLLIFAQVPNPDTLIFASLGGLESLDPHWHYDEASSQITYHVYENLIEFKKDSLVALQPLLATIVPSQENGLIQDQGKTYIFPIREGVTFHNGNSLTPEDVVYSFKRSMILDRTGGPTWMILEPLLGVSSIEELVIKEAGITEYQDLFENEQLKPEYKDILMKVYWDYIDPSVTSDGNNVIFHLKAPCAAFLSVLAQSVSCSTILDREWSIEQGAWDEKAEQWWQYHNPVARNDKLYQTTNGTGPFKLSRWVSGELIQLKRFEQYWNGPAKIEKVLIKIVPEWMTRKLIFYNGEADLIEVPPNFFNEVVDVEGVRVRKDLPMQAINILHFNWTINQEGNRYIGSGKLDGKGIPSDFFSNIHVRKAFSYLFPYQTFIDKTLQGQGERISGPLTRDTLGYLDNPDYYYQQDMEKAREEFKKAWDGELWEKGFSFNIFYTSGAEHAKTSCEMLANFARMLNPRFDIEPVGVSWPTLLKELYSGRLPMFNTGWQVDFPDPHAWLAGLLSSDGTLGQAYGENYSIMAGELIDPLIDEALDCVNSDRREQLYNEIIKISHDKATALYLCQHYGYHVEQEWVQGWYYHPLIPAGIFAGDFYSMYKKID